MFIHLILVLCRFAATNEPRSHVVPTAKVAWVGRLSGTEMKPFAAVSPPFPGSRPLTKQRLAKAIRCRARSSPLRTEPQPTPASGSASPPLTVGLSGAGAGSSSASWRCARRFILQPLSSPHPSHPLEQPDQRPSSPADTQHDDCRCRRRIGLGGAATAAAAADSRR